jgi:hypothetical protein
MTLASGFREKERAPSFTHTHELSSSPGDRSLPLEKRDCSEQAEQPGQQEGSSTQHLSLLALTAEIVTSPLTVIEYRDAERTCEK